MNLWIPQDTARDGIGELPDGVALGPIPREDDLPGEILEAGLLVPR